MDGVEAVFTHTHTRARALALSNIVAQQNGSLLVVEMGILTTILRFLAEKETLPLDPN